MIRVLSVFGTRPEAVKMAPVVKELARRPEIESLVCVTAQHREMLDQILNAFTIRPDYDLDIMRPSQTLCELMSAALPGLRRVLGDAEPDLVLVHGDTSTTLAGALAAYYARIPLGHVEAGLRTGDKYSPFPEEMNRQLTDRLSDLCFAPTARSREQLLREGIPPDRITVTGNTAVDALRTTVRPSYRHPLLDWVGDGNRLILLTAHRRENLGEPLERIFRAVREVAESFDDVRVVFPMHRNPLVREAARVLEGCGRILLTGPLDVLDFHNILSRACLILTDSGGVQEEAPSLGKPVLVLRDTTERPEGVEAGALKLVGTGEEAIVRETARLLTDPAAYARMSRASDAYGDGHASERIADAILGAFGDKKARSLR